MRANVQKPDETLTPELPSPTEIQQRKETLNTHHRKAFHRRHGICSLRQLLQETDIWLQHTLSPGKVLRLQEASFSAIASTLRHFYGTKGSTPEHPSVKGRNDFAGSHSLYGKRVRLLECAVI